jgi:hypothetical protein
MAKKVTKEQRRKYYLKYSSSDKGKKTKRDYFLKNKEKIGERKKAWRLKNPHKTTEYYKKYKKFFPEKIEKKNFQSRILLSKIRISFEDFKALKEKQGGKCAICKGKNKSERGLAIDHNHKTGKFRELLCHRCNIGLGMFWDNKDLLKMAINYLEKHDK